MLNIKAIIQKCNFTTKLQAPKKIAYSNDYSMLSKKLVFESFFENGNSMRGRFPNQ